MSTKIRPYMNFVPSGRVLKIGLLIIFALALTTGFVWMQMDQVIAPPGLRLLDWLWKAFV